MKEAEYIAAICKPFCSFYKEGKESMACGGYIFLKKQLTPSELKQLSELEAKSLSSAGQIPPANRKLQNLVCKKCDFLADGCDFAENRSGPPCGGYILIEKLIR